MIYEPVTSCPRFMHVRRLFLAHLLLSTELSFNFTLSERDIIYSFHANPGNGLFEYSHYFRNARAAGATRYYEDWSPHCTSFWVSIARGNNSFYLISQCCNLVEMKAILRYTVRAASLPVSREWSSKFALVFTTSVVQRRGWNCRIATAAGNKLARC